MLMTDAAYRPNVDAVLRAVSEGADPQATLASTYGKTLPVIENELRNYARTDGQKAFAAGLVRRVEAGAAAEPPVVTLGRIKNMVCGSEKPVLVVSTAEGEIRLVIDSPAAIRVMGTSTGQQDLPCGPQDVPVRIGYVPTADPARNTAGLVRLLDFGVK